ncbi:MAG: hypothetical protein CL579_07365 [Alteromonadaceae bacterium]|nr:hypothetical protein [Alteromonadaceae bacterium]
MKGAIKIKDVVGTETTKIATVKNFFRSLTFDSVTSFSFPTRDAKIKSLEKKIIDIKNTLLIKRSFIKSAKCRWLIPISSK